MAEDLVAWALSSGMTTRGQLADALAERAAGRPLAVALLRQGMDEEALWSHLVVQQGHLAVDPAELARAPGPASKLLPGAMAHTLQSLPLEDLGQEVVIAMVDPTDAHALRELRFAIGRPVSAVTAKASALAAALRRAYPDDIPAERSTTPLMLSRMRPSSRPFRSAPASSAPRAPAAVANAAHAPSESRATATSQSRSTIARSIIPPHEASWSDLEAPSPRSSVRALQREPSADYRSLPPIGTVLAGFRSSSSRDAVIRLMCEGALTVARSVVFLALRRGVLRGWDAMGSAVSPDAIRNLWIPATSKSMFKAVVETGEPYEGPYGTTAADDLFRAATGSRGGRIALHSVRVMGKPLGILAVEGVRHGPAGRRRLEEITLGAGRAFERILER